MPPKCTFPPVATTEARRNDTCANCGGPGDDLDEVRRVYVTVDDEGRVTGSETMEAPERWCAACRTLYPHLPTDPDPEAGSRPADGQPTPDPGT
jgi:hypothetical protein